MQLHDFRFANQTLQQRIVISAALMFVLHFTAGTSLWLWFIWCQTVCVVRASTAAQVFHNLVEWLPFYSRIWKSSMPLGFSMLAVLVTPYRPRLSARLLIGIAVFSMVCAWHDISTEQFDLVTFGPPWGGHMGHYFTWWWCHQRPR